ncbi:MAG TPA: hypothetical protein VGG38_20570 [Acidimicrobiales bacterium]
MMWRKGLSVAAASLALAAALSGCTSPRSSLGTGDSACFLDLPAAAGAVHTHGRFIGIHRYSLAALKKTAPRLVRDLEAAHDTATQMCLAAYQGHYTSSGVEKPIGRRSSGTLAVVAVDASNKKVLGTLIIKKAPLHFGHPHVG